MANTNCLQGMRCPKCGSYAPFQIHAQVWVIAYDDDVMLDDSPDIEWSDTSWCTCKNCGFADEVWKFKEEEND